MLNVLLESKARRARRTGGTLASALVHAGLIAGAIVFTRGETNAKPAGPPDKPERTVFVTPRRAPTPPGPRPPTSRTHTIADVRRLPTIDHVPNDIPVVDVDVDVRIATDDELARGGITSTGVSGGGPAGALGGAPEGVLEERYVDRPPRMIGNPTPPAFPMQLREQGRGGRVAVQFVIDTLGRAEMGSLRVVEASDPLFVQSVRAVLGRYRFTPGEVNGQRVRTLVQLPFDFTLQR